MWADFLSLFYPDTCKSCGNVLHKHEQLICNLCFVDLPRLNSPDFKVNTLTKTLTGRFKFQDAQALFTYSKGGKVQKLIHELKYNNSPELGLLMGKLLADELKSSAFSSADFLLPVPLHPKKEKMRGYNQSSKIAEGFGRNTGIPINENLLYRTQFTATQTKKGKQQRWENVDEVFDAYPNQSLDGAKVILIDDVITTGSTIEACANALHKHYDIQLYILAIAFADLSRN